MFRHNHLAEPDINYHYLRNKSTVKKDKHLSQNMVKRQQKNKENIQRLNNTYSFESQHPMYTQDNSQIQCFSTQNMSPNREKPCSNHQNKVAQFQVNIDGEVLFYCKKCATQVASQGFKVQRINSITQRGSFPLKSIRNTPLNLRQQTLDLYSNRSSRQKQREIQLKSFAKKLTKLQAKYKQKKLDLQNICQSFQLQKQNCNTYYDELISHIQEMRKAHIQAIDQESAKNIQICQIQIGQVDECLKDVQEMLVDINTNLDSIASQIDDESYFECLTYYRQKQGVFSHRLEQLGSEAKAWPSTDQETFLTRIQNFKSFLDDLHNLQRSVQQHESRFISQCDSHSEYYS